MFNSTNTLLNFANRQGLYRVWIRANEAQDAPLVSIWIDPEMRPFEPQVKGRCELPIEAEHDCHTAEGDARTPGSRPSLMLAVMTAALLCVLLIPPAWSNLPGK